MRIELFRDKFDDKFISLIPENNMDIFNLGKLSAKFKHLEINFKMENLALQEIDRVVFKEEEFLNYLLEKYLIEK